MLLPTKWLPNNSVHWDEKSPCVVLRTDSSSSRVIVFSDIPIPSLDSFPLNQPTQGSAAAIYYFEIEILSNVNDGGSSEIVIGIAPVNSAQQHDKMHMDTYNSFLSIVGSVAYSSTGMITRGGSVNNSAIRFGTHDVIGCGIGGDRKFFFTCNGKLIPEPKIDDSINFMSTESAYFPAVELLGIGSTIRANFGEDEFQFSIRNVINNPSGHVIPQESVPLLEERAEQQSTSVPSLGHAQTHSFISRISSQLSQPLFRHSQSDPSYGSGSGSGSGNRGYLEHMDHASQEDFQSEDYMVAIASALSLESAENVLSSSETWTDVDAAQAQEALLLLRELIQARSYHDSRQGIEAISALCDTLKDLQRRMRRNLDLSPENGTLLELNDSITEILIEVVKLEEAGENLSASITDIPLAHPSPVSIMYNLRRGTKEEVLISVGQILSICDINVQNKSISFRQDTIPVATRSINDIRVAGGLQTLVSTLLRCPKWPEVELQISMAIAILVAYETDWHILMKESHAVLSSLQLLLLRKDDVLRLDNTEWCGKNLYCLVSLAVSRFCSLLCDECSKPSMKSTVLSNPKLNSDTPDNKLPESALDMHRSLSTNSKYAVMTPATDEAYLSRTLESLVHIIQTLCVGDCIIDSSAENQQDVLRRTHSTVSSISVDGRARATSCTFGSDSNIGIKDAEGIETKVKHIWEGETLCRSRSTPDLHCSDGMATRSVSTKDSSETTNNTSSSQVALTIVSATTDTSLVAEEVVLLCSHALSNLCQIEDFRASLVAGDVLPLLVTWLKDSTLVLSISRPAGHLVYELIKNVTIALASITAADVSTHSSSSVSPPHTPDSSRRVRGFDRTHSNYTIGWIDAQVMAAEVPEALVLFIDMLSTTICDDAFCKKEHANDLDELGIDILITSLISLASRSQNRASLLHCGAPASIVRLLVVVVSRLKCIQQFSTKLASDRDSLGSIFQDNPPSEACSHAGKGLEDLQNQTSFCQNLSGQCLDLLSYFLADNIAEIPPSAPSHGVIENPPALVILIIQPPVISALLHLFSFPPCIARLQAVRVLSMIVEWRQAMEILYVEGISTALAVLLEDANERFKDEISGKEDTEHVTSHHVLEETMRTCYSLANLCHAELSYALQFFENGLMTIMLRTVSNGHIEVQRQAMRCISGMCPVLSVLTPGAHPSLMMAALKSETTRSQSGSVTETRAMAKKLHGNVIDFVNALRQLTHALSSLSVLIKLEALRGISHLAKDDHLRVGIVEGPLQLIITLLLDPQSETELKQLAEDVLVNIGFVGGREDLDVVGNDYNLLSEWFYMRRSLRLQKSCYDLLRIWTNGLFYGCDVAEKRAKQLYIAEQLGREATLAENVDDEDLLFLHFPEGDIDIRDTVDLVGLSVVTNVIEKIVKTNYQNINIQNTTLPSTAHKQSADLREALLLQFTHMFDAWKLLRNPQVSPLTFNLSSDIFPSSISSNEWIKDKSENYFSLSPGGRGISAKKRAGQITERFFAFMTFCTGKGAQRVVEEEEAEQLQILAEENQIRAQTMERDDHSLNLSNFNYSLGDLDDFLNFPPSKVSECLDLFFPSTLHQALVCDSFSIGKPQDQKVETPAVTLSPHHQTQDQKCNTPPRSQQSEFKYFRIPEPKQFRSLILPSREYFTFAREGRVLKKILDDVAKVEKNDSSVEASAIGGYADINKTLWALAFRDSVFHGEFIMTLVNALRSLPQISSVSFVCTRPQEDSELGYFGGNVPPTVRFLSFQNALSTASIDALCTYLRAQNVSFARTNDGSSTTTTTGSSICKSLNQGLVGLSITHTALATEDVNNICDLLKGGSCDVISQESLTQGSTANEGAGSTVVIGRRMARRLYGLLYLDLSNNKLSDEQCSNVLFASLNCPLEGLELKGNALHRGLYFFPVLEKYLSSHHCQLLYLGVSANGFINSTFRSILDCCQSDNSLTSLDLSHNDLTSSERNCSRVREFLKTNVTLRSLNLSHNRFTDGMTRIFHLGLLENDSLILLRLDGNVSLNEREMYLVRGKLKANRDKYVKGILASSRHPVSTSKTDGEFHSERRSEWSTPASHLSFTSAEKSSNSQPKAGGGHHDRTLSDLGDGEKSDISKLFKPRPVVATQLLAYDVADDVPVSTAFFTRDGGDVLSTMAVSGGREEEDKKSTTPLATEETICVLFSAPLAWTDTRNQLHPIQTLDYPGERETLIQAFREASRDIGVRFDFATTQTLRTVLSLGVKTLHFSGHGHPHCLNFEDGKSGLQFVTMEALRSLCQAGGNQLEFVFVSSCHSRRAGEAFVEVGVPHVVCVTVEAALLDAAAIAFTRAFYVALAVGHTVCDSFDIGKQAVITSPYVPNSVVEGEKFLLLPEDADHDTPVFNAKPVNQWPIRGSSLKGLNCDLIDNSYLPHVPEDFEGREVDMYSTIRILLSRRLVTIVGENGCGKSSVAIAVCKYLCERRKFDHGVIFVRLRGIVTHEDFLLTLSQAIKSGSQELAACYASLNDNLRESKGAAVDVSIRDQEEILLKFLSPLKTLIVFVNKMSGLSSEASTDLKMFLSRLFDRCSFIKILTTGSEVIGMTGFGIVEHVVSLGPLNLYSSLRLFARLSPNLATAAQKVKFVKTLLISDQANVTMESRELNSGAAQILNMLGGGHPSKIVKIACESSPDDIRQMLAKAASSNSEPNVDNK